LTKNGKLDRAQLPNPFAKNPAAISAPTPEDTPDSRLVESIVDLWREVLGVGDIDPDDTFFDAGGDSLLAVRLYGAVQRRFGVVLTNGIIDRDFTVGRFVDAVRDALSRAAPPLLVEMTTVDGPPVVLVAPGGGDLDRYRWLVPALAGRFRVVGIREPGHYGTEARPRSVGEASEVCAAALREAGIATPLAIIGECAGGVLAHQLACDIGRDGATPDLVVLLDTPIPGAAEDREPVDRWTRMSHTVSRRGHDAFALARMKAQWEWYRFHRRPVPPKLAHSMTMRANARRVRNARPSFFNGHVLYVQAVDEAGQKVTLGAPEYWSARAGQLSTVTAPGEHTGTESFLSKGNAVMVGNAIVHALESVQQVRDR
jgi:thioesterase domain-containing protein/acyl carrier protein